jgi:hypothetical protein
MGDMKSIIGGFYKANLAVMNMGAFAMQSEEGCICGRRADPAQCGDSVARERSGDKRWQSGPRDKDAAVYRACERTIRAFAS